MDAMKTKTRAKARSSMQEDGDRLWPPSGNGRKTTRRPLVATLPLGPLLARRTREGVF